MFGSAAQKLLLLSSLMAPLATGCAATVYEEDVVYVRHRHNHVVFHDAPNLVYIGDGVYVVQDYGTAVYYTGGSYYYYDDGLWYSSTSWNSPWSTVQIGFVPTYIHHQHHHQYVHYHGGHGAHVVKAPSHGGGHHGAEPTHSGHQASAPSKPESHTKSQKYEMGNVDNRASADLTGSRANAPRDAGNKYTNSDQARSQGRADVPSSRNDVPSNARPSDDETTRSGKTSKPSQSVNVAPRASSPSASKPPTKTKKAKPTRKKSRR